MTEYILLIHGNTKTQATPEEWDEFFKEAQHSGIFKGGSEIGERVIVGDTVSAKPSEHIVGFLRFDTEDKQDVLELLLKNPVVMHGGSVELCEMRKS